MWHILKWYSTTEKTAYGCGPLSLVVCRIALDVLLVLASVFAMGRQILVYPLFWLDILGSGNRKEQGFIQITEFRLFRGSQSNFLERWLMGVRERGWLFGAEGSGWAPRRGRHSLIWLWWWREKDILSRGEQALPGVFCYITVDFWRPPSPSHAFCDCP